MDYLRIQPGKAVLVLNSSYEPLNITSWKRAIVLLLKEKAQVLSDRVIRLLDYVKVPLSKIMSHKPSRAMIYKRDKNSCQYCGSTRNLTIDHVVPRCRGGDDSWENLVVACSPCNTRKGNSFLEHIGMRLLKRPRAPFNKMQFILDNSNIQEWLEYSF
jgi:5-methylcytosine-specific restriction endonuclease McrA